MSSHSNLEVEYGVLDPEQIDLIRPLWERLNAHHACISTNFSEELRARRFQDRKSQLLGDDKRLHILLVSPSGAKNPIAYCIASVTPSGEGEIDSMFVEEEYRGRGIGTNLMKRSLTWLDESSATTKSVVVLFENDEALNFYARFGFYPRNVNLIQKKLTTQVNPIPCFKQEGYDHL
jgi:GNAT superfamily N-acetyltransferase